MDDFRLGTTIKTLLGLLLSGILYCGLLYVYTTIQFKRAVNGRKRPSSDSSISPPLLAYAVPYLGSTLSFANQNTGQFWQWLLSNFQHAGLGAVTAIIGGQRTHFIFSPATVSGAFRSRELTRYELDRQLGINCLAMSKEDAIKAFPEDIEAKDRLTTKRILAEYLLSSSGVNTLTAKFLEFFQAGLTAEATRLAEAMELNLYEWVRGQMFIASTNALCGTKLLEMHPDFSTYFWRWDHGLLDMLFGKPRLLARQAYASRDILVSKMASWLEEAYRHGGIEADPEWEPYFGARVMRKRHEFHKQQEMSLKGQAGADLVFLGGIISNAIPTTGWLLMHLLSPMSPPNFLPTIMSELKSAQRADGSIDIPTLTALPHLNSAFHEILRLYVDLLLVRNVDTPCTLGSYAVRRGDMVMATTWMTHRNPAYYDRPDEFVPDRFINADPATGEAVFSTIGLTGKLFPFGGGHYMCPGRTFAKQEVFATVAMLLLNYDIDFQEFVRPTKSGWKGVGAKKDGFPKLAKGFAGNVAVGLDGDMRVAVRRKRWQ